MITRKMVAFWLAIPGTGWTFLGLITLATRMGIDMMEALGLVGVALLVASILVAFWPRGGSK